MFYLYHKRAWYQRRPEEGVRLELQPVTEITDNCELLGRYWEQNRASLEKQSVRLTRLDGESSSLTGRKAAGASGIQNGLPLALLVPMCVCPASWNESGPLQTL